MRNQNYDSAAFAIQLGVYAVGLKNVEENLTKLFVVLSDPNNDRFNYATDHADEQLASFVDSLQEIADNLYYLREYTNYPQQDIVF